ncbi:interleukin-26 [Lepisosteus oculatus]|uniref:interleukin-26 n=1 Tax=Lepisosteus oculatus TaxID=7918 RepID=UPI0037209217
MKAHFAAALIFSAMAWQRICEAKGTGIAGQKCLQNHLPGKMLKELFEMSLNLKYSVPRDNIKERKLLPKFGPSLKRPNPHGIPILKEILDFYLKDVLKKVEVVDLKADNLVIYLTRLDKDLGHCLRLHPSICSSRERKLMNKMKKRYKEMADQGVYKAIGELETVIDWINTYMHAGKE